MSNWKTILVGIDGSQPSRSALRWAADQAERNQCDIVALNAEPDTDTCRGRNISRRSARPGRSSDICALAIHRRGTRREPTCQGAARSEGG